MMIDTTCMLCIIPESEEEHSEWEALLSLESWADGEFGMMLTEAAFRSITNESIDDCELPIAVRTGMKLILDSLEKGDYSDVCLMHTPASTRY